MSVQVQLLSLAPIYGIYLFAFLENLNKMTEYSLLSPNHMVLIGDLERGSL